MKNPRTVTHRDRRDLIDLIVEHAWLLDHGRWHDVADLYLDEGSMTLGPHTLQGRRGLLAWADKRAQNTGRLTHHQCTNVRLRADPDAPGEMTGTVLLVLHASQDGSPPQVEFVGEYRDQYRRDESGRWRFLRRDLQALQSGAAAGASSDAG